jgi:hypothetical protein
MVFTKKFISFPIAESNNFSCLFGLHVKNMISQILRMIRQRAHWLVRQANVKVFMGSLRGTKKHSIGNCLSISSVSRYVKLSVRLDYMNVDVCNIVVLDKVDYRNTCLALSLQIYLH